MNYLGIDYGRRRIGLALGSDSPAFAHPLRTIAAEELFDALPGIVREHKIDRMVVGLPRGLEGQETKQTQEVRKFIMELEDRVDLPVETADEALTSEVAGQRLGPNAPKEAYDMEAAAIFLQDYLNQ